MGAAEKGLGSFGEFCGLANGRLEPQKKQQTAWAVLMSFAGWQTAGTGIKGLMPGLANGMGAARSREKDNENKKERIIGPDNPTCKQFNKTQIQDRKRNREEKDI